MAEITAQLVKQLRERTGAGMMECKAALVEAKGDLAEAEVVLRKRGITSAGKKASRTTKQGIIGSYIHQGSQLGVLVEVNCESDFVARTGDFQELVHDLAMHIAAADPQYVRKEDVTPEALEGSPCALKSRRDRARPRAQRGPDRDLHLPRQELRLRPCAPGVLARIRRSERARLPSTRQGRQLRPACRANRTLSRPAVEPLSADGRYLRRISVATPRPSLISGCVGRTARAHASVCLVASDHICFAPVRTVAAK